MNHTLAILVITMPFLLSLGWFAFWVIRVLRTAKKLKKRDGSAAPGTRPSSPSS